MRYVVTGALCLVATVLLCSACRGRTHRTPDRSDTPAERTPIAETMPSHAINKYERVVMPEGVTSEMLEYYGFTVSFNKDYHQPNYVSWELTGNETMTNAVGKRQNNFMADLEVDGCASLDDYRGSGYDRGHMAPAGDMRWDRKASESCFLLTNMTPQRHSLNNGAWRILEERCRDWAVRDSAIVIVCGPVLTDRMTDSIGPNRVPVPERFFKVILSYNAKRPMAIGFIMNNGNVEGGIQAAAVPVDEVERITGFDFFSALPDDIEDALEAECNFAKWTRRR